MECGTGISIKSMESCTDLLSCSVSNTCITIKFNDVRGSNIKLKRSKMLIELDVYKWKVSR